MEPVHAESKKRAREFLLTFKEFIYIFILTSFFVFLSFVGHIRTEPSPTSNALYVSYFGFPLEWFRMKSNLYYSWSTVTTLEILWVSFAFDVVVFIILSLVIMFGANKINERISSASL